MDATANLVDRCRDLGTARLALAAELQTPEAWRERWTPPEHDFPFRWGTCWTQCTTYGVEDYAAEIGFFHDLLGLPANAFSADFCMFTSPDKAFYLAVVPAGDELAATPPESLDLGFMVQDLPAVAEELERRGVVFSAPPAPYGNSPMLKAELRTPAGIRVSLWAMAQSA